MLVVTVKINCHFTTFLSELKKLRTDLQFPSDAKLIY